ncbi:hypothetical protein PHYC_03806 [Phycisphaerales bacterium]|nr:hypothetical protein PHYC_03806 [Phycisphaerales bacterium]
MTMNRAITRTLAVLALTTLLAVPSRADDLRNVKRGEPVPAYRLPAIDGALIESDSFKGSVVVVVCLSAEQRRSELAAMDSLEVVGALGSDHVRLVHVTADVVQKAYFEKFRADRKITAPLAFDADRSFYARLGLIVFPTTIVVDKDGKLTHVISLHTGEYKHTLDAYVKHALGAVTDEQLKGLLAARTADETSPRSVASAHRALARSLRDKGQLQAARDELTKAREQEPENREVILDLADLDLVMNDLDAADSLIAKVLETQPDHRRAKQLKGITLYRRGQLDQAQAVLQEALDLNPSPELAHYYLGKIFEQKGETAKALEHYREALKRFIHDADPAPVVQKDAK